MDIVEQLNRIKNKYGNPCLLSHEAAKVIERLRQQNAELRKVVEEVIDPECTEPVGTQAWLDKVYDILDRTRGGE